MRRLILVRHAQAEPSHPGQEDWERRLEASGQRDARTMAQRLKAQEVKPDRILTSPAVRALETATTFGRELRATKRIRQDERLYLANAAMLLQVIQELGAEAPVLMVVGHNPGLTEVADELSRERSIDNLPTAAVYSLEFDIERWSEIEPASGLNAEFDYPRRG